VSVKLQKRGFSKQLNIAFVINIILLSLISSAFIAYVTYERERTAYIKHGVSIANGINTQLAAPFAGISIGISV